MKRLLFIGLILTPFYLFAAYLQNIPSPVIQPDGSTLNLLASGDEYANRLHDADGFTIIQSPTDGYYYYAVLQDSEPVPSAWRVGDINPTAQGLQPNINISKTAYLKKVDQMRIPDNDKGRSPSTGTVNNINIFIRFSDQTEFEETRGEYDLKFNPIEDNSYSMRNYFRKASYNQLDFITYHYPECSSETNLSYVDSHPRNYYVPYNVITNPIGYNDSDERTYREMALLANAVNSIASQVPVDLNIDADNDGGVDNVCFIIRGPHTAWAELLWAHRWAMYYEDVFINGKQVWDFTFQPENQNNVRVLCHEMFHSAGSPDLYHYEYDGVTPVGPWDIMESGDAHMGMYMKYKYGQWIPTIPVITSSGNYTLNPVSSATNNAYRVNIPGNQTEYFVLEYRKQGSDPFEELLPGSGLLIYRILTTEDGNADGPPDEIYIYRPNGSGEVNGLIADAAFSSDNFRTEFNRYTNPNCFLTNNNLANISIHSISQIGETISFYVGINDQLMPPVISNVYPPDGAVLAVDDYTLSLSVNAPNSTVASVDFYVDNVFLGVTDYPPFTYFVNSTVLTPGYHQIVITAHAENGMSSSKLSTVRIVDPQVQTWFNWLTETPVWGEYGRGAVPIKAAIDIDLGEQEYLVKKLAFHLSDDVWGDPTIPGMINAKINRFANGAITEQTLIDLGDIYCDLDGRFEYIVNSTVPITGQIAVILDLFEYQNMVFDLNAPSGHSWMTEPNRPWTDALGRGIQGAAAIELLLQTPYVGNDDCVEQLSLPAVHCNPNPFVSQVFVSYDIPKNSRTDLGIYNIRGQKVRSLVNAIQSSGSYGATWDGRDDSGSSCSAGIYFFRLKSDDHVLSGKMLYVK